MAQTPARIRFVCIGPKEAGEFLAAMGGGPIEEQIREERLCETRRKNERLAIQVHVKSTQEPKFKHGLLFS